MASLHYCPCGFCVSIVVADKQGDLLPRCLPAIEEELKNLRAKGDISHFESRKLMDAAIADSGVFRTFEELARAIRAAASFTRAFIEMMERKSAEESQIETTEAFLHLQFDPITGKPKAQA